MKRKIMNTCCDCIGSIPRFVRHFITQLEAIFEFFGIIDSRHVLKCLFFLKKSKFVLVLLLEIGNKGFLQSGNLLLYSRFLSGLVGFYGRFHVNKGCQCKKVKTKLEVKVPH